ncbi:hypothetical protein [Pedobacter sp. L105]|uniref:hypothetical protein n=1 Tax=Pedobacter sp. L105 TaxID=1641871 RepID=UPI00131DFA88|nr:hypothetical protein [Pedobacter sp. L105]
MKGLFTLVLGLLATSSFGQVKTDLSGQFKSVQSTPSTVPVFYKKSAPLSDQKNPVLKVLIYMDSVEVGETVPILDIRDLKNVFVIKGSDFNRIYLTSSKTKSYHFLTLEEIKDKYVKTPYPATLYMLDDKMIEGEPGKIDENYILGISVITSDDIPSLKNTSLKMTIINITTKSEENLQKKRTIHLRGSLAGLMN